MSVCRLTVGGFAKCREYPSFCAVEKNGFCAMNKQRRVNTNATIIDVMLSYITVCNDNDITAIYDRCKIVSINFYVNYM